MVKIIKKTICYIGIETPKTENEINVEIDGLRHAICVANETIAKLQQAISIVKLEKNE